MQKVSSVAELKNAIKLLETEQGDKGRLLKDHLLFTYESLRPANLIRSTLQELFLSSSPAENISGTIAGLASGFVLKKLFVGKSAGFFKKLLGSIFQYGLTKIITKNAAVIQSAGLALFQYFTRKNE